MQKRGELVDWMVEMHLTLRLFAPTLFAAVSIMDQYCCLTTIETMELSMLAVTSLFLSAKYEETYNIPSLKDMQKAASLRTLVDKTKIV